ncbi:hypothetical protein [Vibrio quintilis]|uniref:Uncharacterized protein n=1 Tax=Vibrio quintilis TaxID=1117707 RepID=A0A1M7YU68_9VIBR|nr:hypothetical protein [Vibrio quintilis]SHO56143.1 hypothetical protein VQ7734_01910 [Vibrio quintilis]
MCAQELFGMCFVHAGSSSDSLFGFSSFISALALLFVVYTITGERYKFRISIAPVPLYKASFYTIPMIGIAVLISELWVNLGWLTPDFNLSQSVWQAIFALLFLIIISLWAYYGFISPPVFGKKNYKEFMLQLYERILDGNVDILKEVASEITPSIRYIVAYASDDEGECRNYAHDIILLLGNKRFCEVVAEYHPNLIIELYENLTKENIQTLPIRQFTKNTAAAAILNSNSLLHHEGDGFSSGLIGYIKPLSIAMYGDIVKLEALNRKFASPLDADLSLFNLKHAQFQVYCDSALTAIQSYLNEGWWWKGSCAINNAFAEIKYNASYLYEINSYPTNYHDLECYKNFRVAVKFVNSAIKLLENHPSVADFTPHKLRKKEGERYQLIDLYDLLAELMFELTFSAASVNVDVDTCWSIQHNSCWREFIGYRNSKVSYYILKKYYRLIFDEVKGMEKLPNFKSARILGFCLNIFGVKIPTRDGFGKEYYSLRKVIIHWTIHNYESIRKEYCRIAEACLFGCITYEDKKLIKTYRLGVRDEAPKEILELK